MTYLKLFKKYFNKQNSLHSRSRVSLKAVYSRAMLLVWFKEWFFKIISMLEYLWPMKISEDKPVRATHSLWH
jgi:hypothetical protein